MARLSDCISFTLFDEIHLADCLEAELGIKKGKLEIHAFPDHETKVRIKSEVSGKTVVLICTLNQPNEKILPLLFSAMTLKSLGAKNIYLVAPYLAYMRQDKAFHPGEAVSAKLFAVLLSSHFDGLITVDPHLHRIKTLGEIYTLPSKVLHATEAIANWLFKQVKNPLLIGPDAESEQWVSAIASHHQVPYAICEKHRIDDQSVQTYIPEVDAKGRTVVLVDDIISSGASMLVLLEALKQQEVQHILCITVHALFDVALEKRLIQMGADAVFSCNTIKHTSNRIDLSSLLIQGIYDMIL